MCRLASFKRGAQHGGVSPRGAGPAVAALGLEGVHLLGHDVGGPHRYRARTACRSRAGRFDVAARPELRSGSGDRLKRMARNLAHSCGEMRSHVPLGALKVLTEGLVTFLVGERSIRPWRLRHSPLIRAGGALTAGGRLGVVAGQHHGRVVERQAGAAPGSASMSSMEPPRNSVRPMEPANSRSPGEEKRTGCPPPRAGRRSPTPRFGRARAPR